MKIQQAITALYPGRVWSMDNDDLATLVMHDDGPDLDHDKIMDFKEAHEYQELRAREYPALGDQLDALWKGGDAAAAMLKQVQDVKAKYPKP